MHVLGGPGDPCIFIFDQHAALCVDAKGCFWLVDLHSTRGTYILPRRKSDGKSDAKSDGAPPIQVPAGKARQIPVGGCFLLEDPSDAEVMFRIDAGAFPEPRDEVVNQTSHEAPEARVPDSQAGSIVSVRHAEEGQGEENDDDDHDDDYNGHEDSENELKGENERKRSKKVRWFLSYACIFL